MKSELEYANELIEKYEEITKYGRWYDKILCAIQDVENTIEAFENNHLKIAIDNYVFYKNVLQILKDKL